MGWKDRFPKPQDIPARNALERIRAANSIQDFQPFDELDDEQLEVFAAVEMELRPAHAAGTLAPDIILPNGRHVGGVHFYPYDGAGAAWAARLEKKYEGMLLRGKAGEGAYQFTPDDIERIAAYVGRHAAEEFGKACESDLALCGTAYVRDANINRRVLEWLQNPEHEAAFNTAFEELFIRNSRPKSPKNIEEWVNRVQQDILEHGWKGTSVASTLATLPDHWSFHKDRPEGSDRGRFLRATFDPLKKQLQQDENRLRSEEFQSINR